MTEAGRAARALTFAVNYRLAPEHPFPAAYEDALIAWKFLRNRGIPAAHIAIGDSRVSPLYGDFAKFPPMLIQVGSDETLLDDATRLAARAGAANVAVTLEIWPQMIHAWPLWNAHLKDGSRALASAGEFIRAHFD